MEPATPLYPSDAYAAPGQLWWHTLIWPGKRHQKFGTEPRLAAWLYFNAQLGEILTLRKLREALGDTDGPVDHEHFNRRFRNLRKYGWRILSSREVAGLKQDEYRLECIGSPIWLGKSQFTKKGISAKIRRQIFDRDGRRCLVCGIGAGETYPDEPCKRARLTIGHFVADSLRGQNDPANLRTECSICNEPSKEEASRSESAEEIWPKIRALARADKARLLLWLDHGQRDRDVIDRLFDQYRCLPPAQRDDIRTKLAQAVKGAGS